MVTVNWWEGLHQVYHQNSQLQQLLNHYHQGDLDSLKYQLRGGFLFYKGRLHLGTLKVQHEQVMQQFYRSPMGGHTGLEKTHSRIKKEFFRRGMRKDIRKFIRECEVFQRNKIENLKPARALQPLPIPSKAWVDISMNF